MEADYISSTSSISTSTTTCTSTSTSDPYDYIQFWNCPTQVSGKHLGFKNNHERVSRKPITLVVGAPIPAKQIANPCEEDVEKLHAKYVRHLQRLYKEHNPYPEIKLVIG